MFPAKEFEFVFDMSSAFLPGTGSKHIKINTSFYFLPGLPGRSTLVFRTMFTKTQNAFSYAHTEHFFLKLFVKKCKINAAALPRGYAVPCIHLTNYVKFAAANANNFAEN